MTIRIAAPVESLARPRIDLSFDGALVTSVVPDARGHYVIELALAQAQIEGGWHDLYLVLGTGPSTPQVPAAWLESVTWEPMR